MILTLARFEAPFNPTESREKMAEILFESFNVPRYACFLQGTLSLFCSGRITGLTVDSGDGVTHIVPIYEGYSIPHAVKRNDVAGHRLTDYLHSLLEDRGVTWDTARHIKEKMCYVAADFQAELGQLCWCGYC